MSSPGRLCVLAEETSWSRVNRSASGPSSPWPRQRPGGRLPPPSAAAIASSRTVSLMPCQIVPGAARVGDGEVERRQVLDVHDRPAGAGRADVDAGAVLGCLGGEQAVHEAAAVAVDHAGADDPAVAAARAARWPAGRPRPGAGRPRCPRRRRRRPARRRRWCRAAGCRRRAGRRRRPGRWRRRWGRRHGSPGRNRRRRRSATAGRPGRR